MLAESFLTVLSYKDNTDCRAEQHGWSSACCGHAEGHSKDAAQAQRALAIKEEAEQEDFELSHVQSVGGAHCIPSPLTSTSSPVRYPTPTPQIPLQPSDRYTHFSSNRADRLENSDFRREQDAYKLGEDAAAVLPMELTEQGLEAVAPDNGYLVMDSSITLQGGEPLTNSMLNGYLESKLTDLYTYYLQERLGRPGTSPRLSLLTPFVPPAYVVQQLSHQVALEQGLEVDEARSLVLGYMHTQGGDSWAVSSHFSSPVLRISQPEEKRPM
ncbi:hypothetical protein ACEWY4_027266 [Coilia grayii]|uniref:Uncharacterized protein n=1 Tax=Coilia grayii TaxID=363190 RepID=A0ABD1IS23_9TELE